MIKRMNGKKGFTMVEVIVVAVIVGVLATVGILLYNGYVAQARQSSAENLAASAATYLQTVSSAVSPATAAALGAAGLAGGAAWNQPIPNGPNVVFTCPANAVIAAGAANAQGNPTINATIGGSVSANYAY